MKVKVWLNDWTKGIIWIVGSALLSVFSLRCFVDQANVYPGGFMGISLLFSQILRIYGEIELPYSICYGILNIISTLLVLHYVGKRFLLLSILQYGLVCVFLELFPTFVWSSDRMLLTLIGAALNGLSSVLALRANASTGGSDFIAIYLSFLWKKPAWDFMMLMDYVVFIVAGLLFGMEQALYSFIFSFLAITLINNMHSRFKLSECKIITTKSSQIRKELYLNYDHGITQINVSGGYDESDKQLLFTICNTYELKDLIDLVYKIDHNAFVTTSPCDSIKGNYVQKHYE